jgi:hypothetical protein
MHRDLPYTSAYGLDVEASLLAGGGGGGSGGSPKFVLGRSGGGPYGDPLTGGSRRCTGNVVTQGCLVLAWLLPSLILASVGWAGYSGFNDACLDPDSDG